MSNTDYTPENETWKDVPGYEGLYQASDMGRIRRAKIMGNNKRPAFGVLKTHRGKRYSSTYLSDEFGEQKKHLVHKIIMLAFAGERPEKYHINHKNGDKHDNRLSNLEYCTASENVKHAFRELGRVPRHGESHHNNKLTEQDVAQIRQLLSEGKTSRDIAKRYPVTERTIGKIKRGERWKRLK